MKKIKTAEIICVGTELLLGDVVNTNAAYLSRKLAELGISVYHQSVIGDNPSRLRESIEVARRRCDLIIFSGGLGPTYDDLTKETVAETFGCPLVLDKNVLEDISSYFKSLDRVMEKNNEKQAQVPDGGLVFKNNYGTAPGVAMFDKESQTTAILLPGPPREIEPMFDEQVMPYLESRSNAVIVSRNIHLFGIGESSAEKILKELMESSVNPSLAPYCTAGEVRLRVTAKAASKEEALSLCAPVIDAVMKTEVCKFVYGIDCETIENALVKALISSKKTLACAESCTGGLIAKRITDVSGCSEVFLGGAVSYANSAKEKLLGVSSSTLEEFGAVSEQTAIEMARGIRKALGSDIGISTTGVAGPLGGTKQKPVGTVFVGVSTEKGDFAKHLTLSSKRERSYIRTLASSNALILALDQIK